MCPADEFGAGPGLAPAPAQAARATGVPVALVMLIAGRRVRCPDRSLTRDADRRGRHTCAAVPVRVLNSTTRARLLFGAEITAGCIGSILRDESLLPIFLVVAGSLGRQQPQGLPPGTPTRPGPRNRP